MAFEWRGGEPPYVNFEVDEDEDCLAVRYYIGRDQKEGVMYFVALEFSPYLDEASREFSFYIIRRVMADDRQDVQQIYSGQETAEIFSDDVRRHILNVVVTGIDVLLSHEKPQTIYRATADRRPPDRAALKHERVSQAFRTHGYNVWRADDHVGQRVWIVTQLSDQGYQLWRKKIEAEDDT